MDNIEPVARIQDIEVLSFTGKASKYSGTSSSFNDIEAIQINSFNFDSLALEMLVFRPTSFTGTFMRMKACANMPLFVGDIVYNGSDVVSTIEFLIGGRVGINSSTSVVIVNERSVADHHMTPIRNVLKNTSIWVKADAKTLKQPIEIQTNGGTLGIKG